MRGANLDFRVRAASAYDPDRSYDRLSRVNVVLTLAHRKRRRWVRILCSVGMTVLALVALRLAF